MPIRVINQPRLLQGQIKIKDGVPVLTGPTGTLLWTINNPEPANSDRFGGAVAIDGDYAVIGAYSDSHGGVTSSGSAYIYDITTNTLLHTLHNPTPEFGDDFGCSVAISGNYVIIGERFTDSSVSDSGSAYIYDLTSGTPTIPVHILSNPTPEQSDKFGECVSISGNYAIVGANGDNTGATSAGSAYIYDLTSGTPTVPVYTLNNPTPSINSVFGSSVAISGNHAIVGGIGNDTGAQNAGSAYIYDLNSGTPTVPVHTLTNPTPEVADYFGISVSIDGNRAIVGAYSDDTGADNAGSAYIYDVSTGSLLHTINNPTPALNDYFGYSVSISGNYAIVGAYFDDTGAGDAGSAYIYNASTGALVHTINNPTPTSNDQFGVSVAISGSTLIVGALGVNLAAGVAYIYN